MLLFLDCEFNGFGGDLISMALVDFHGQSFYQVLECPKPVAWVEHNVIPHLNQPAVSLKIFQHHLAQFLNQYHELDIIADWPEDFVHFNRALITGAGLCITTPPLTMHLWRPTSLVASAQPHNALSDAHALAGAYKLAMQQLENQT